LGVIERLGIGGLPLGIMKDALYLSGEVVMQTGDWLATFTDGVIQAENNVHQEYGEHRLITILNSGVMLTPAMLLNSIMVDLDRFVGDAPQHDDITCILLRAT
jgi:phosphoserine phosphatase RsbU/P